MRIVVLNGSPRGKKSISRKASMILEKLYPQHTFEFVDVAPNVGRWERDEAAFQEAMDTVAASDGVIWSFPLYILIVSSQYKRFIELIWERGAQDAFAGKYAVAYSTSIHYYDHVAHNYVNGICDDLGMRYVGFYSAKIQDLLDETKRAGFLHFAERFFAAIESGAPMTRRTQALVPPTLEYTPAQPAETVNAAGRRVLILTDEVQASSNQARMVARLAQAYGSQAQVVNLHDVDIKGPCMECLHCGADFECMWAGKDGFREFYDQVAMKADIVFFCGRIVDRFLSSRWRLFWDRGFCWTHTPSLKDQQHAFVISGPLRQLPNVRQFLDAYTQWQHSNLLGTVTDEAGSSAELDAQIDHLAREAVIASQAGYQAPQTFLGVAGQKLFRDEMWGDLRAVFYADYQEFGRLGYLDFPHKNWKIRLVNWFLVPLLRIPKVKAGFQKGMVETLNRPWNKLIDRLGPKDE